MRIRAKISYHALITKQTVLELILNQMVQSYSLFENLGVIKRYVPNENNIANLQRLLKGDMHNSFKMAVQINSEQLGLKSEILEKNLIE